MRSWIYFSSDKFEPLNPVENKHSLADRSNKSFPLSILPSENIESRFDEVSFKMRG